MSTQSLRPLKVEPLSPLSDSRSPPPPPEGAVNYITFTSYKNHQHHVNVDNSNSNSNNSNSNTAIEEKTDGEELIVWRADDTANNCSSSSVSSVSEEEDGNTVTVLYFASEQLEEGIIAAAVCDALAEEEEEAGDLGEAIGSAAGDWIIPGDLEQLIDLNDWIKDEEPFNNWLEEKMLPQPTFGEPPLPIAVSTSKPLKPPTHHYNQLMPPQDTQSLLREFESVFDSVEGLANNTTTTTVLTPPQSPPNNHHLQYNLTPPQTPPYSQLLVLEPQQQVPVYYPKFPQQDKVVAQELAEVDELVRARVEYMVPSSPANSTSSSSGCSSSSEDPEWAPAEKSSSSSSSSSKSSKASVRKSKGPYTRNVEEKRSRKKEQNKNAATRYRQKKKDEVTVIVGEERGLMDEHDKLQGNITDLQREIKYLKGLMRDLFKAKGLIE